MKLIKNNPLVVKSTINQNEYAKVSYFDWNQLVKPRAGMWKERNVGWLSSGDILVESIPERKGDSWRNRQTHNVWLRKNSLKWSYAVLCSVEAVGGCQSTSFEDKHSRSFGAAEGPIMAFLKAAGPSVPGHVTRPRGPIVVQHPPSLLVSLFRRHSVRKRRTRWLAESGLVASVLVSKKWMTATVRTISEKKTTRNKTAAVIFCFRTDLWSVSCFFIYLSPRFKKIKKTVKGIKT